MSRPSSLLVRKSSRAIKKSERARESDERIPGIDSSSANMALPSPVSDVQSTTHLPSPDPLSEPARRKYVLKSTSKAAKGKQTPRGVVKKHARRSAKRTISEEVTPEEITAQPAPFRGMTNTRAQSFAQASMPVNSTDQSRPPGDLLSRLQLHIYAWPEPRPKDLESITEWHRKWKDRQDVREALVDNDVDLDDWFVKSGNAAAYSSSTPIFSLQYSIARSFIMRAKRAYRLDSTWEDFEDSELAIDSMSQAREVQDPHLRILHMKEAVDNNLRLKIFLAIRRRLCTEIWLQHFSELRRPLIVDHSGYVVAPIPGLQADTAPGRARTSNEMAAASPGSIEHHGGGERTTQASRDGENLGEEKVSLVFQLSFAPS